ncbi:MAG: HAD family phosphatase [Butyricicoccus sp.]|nr:HAD family phosphatase [Butyricicoccus sp.]
MIRAVIFDMDGLMFDTERISYELTHDICARHGLDYTLDMKRRMCGANFDACTRIFREELGIDDSVLTFGQCWSEVRERMAQDFAAHGIPCKPGLRELLDFLSAHGIRMAVASGSSTAVVQKYLDLAGLPACFSALVGGSDIQNPKPAPDCFLLAAERLGVEPADCLVLEDSNRGLQAALRAGMHAIWVPDLDRPDPETEQRLDAVCPSLADVANWLRPQITP